jgi:hypothetical protein
LADGKDSVVLVYSGDEWLDSTLAWIRLTLSLADCQPTHSSERKTSSKRLRSHSNDDVASVGYSCGEGVTVFPSLPVVIKTLYLHGELSPGNQRRFRSSIQELERPFLTFYQARSQSTSDT